MSSEQPGSDPTNIGWPNVGLALCFIAFNVTLSGALGLGVGTSLAVAAGRCIGQLAIVATVLAQVFAKENPWMTAGIAVVNKSQRRYSGMFLSTLVCMLGSTIPIALIGSRFAIANDPFWRPIKFIPLVGMLCGSTISGINVAANSVLKELRFVGLITFYFVCSRSTPNSENREKVEMLLAFGASRMEACRPIARDALRTALTPSINQMSVLGIISIPGMMTGAILGGSSVEQAAKLQMVIMFMISASTALASIYTVVSAITVTVDREHRIREDRITEGGHVLHKLKEAVGTGMGTGISSVFKGVFGKLKKITKKKGEEADERSSLLGDNGRAR